MATTEDMELARQLVDRLEIGHALIVDSGPLAAVLSEIGRERVSQDARWGPQAHGPEAWLAILAEEVGEVAKEIADGRVQTFSRERYRAELVQVAAVAAAAIECLDTGAAGGS